MVEVKADGAPALPQSRVRDVIRLDADMEGLSVRRDALLTVSKAAELFIELLVQEAMNGTQGSVKKIEYKHIAEAVHGIPAFAFLQEMVPLDSSRAVHLDAFAGLAEAATAEDVNPTTDQHDGTKDETPSKPAHSICTPAVAVDNTETVQSSAGSGHFDALGPAEGGMDIET
ncbi:hypothetical protein FVE85_8343 [Porphyridium purpureum]|uniref:Transcription factor CBF/NF-Y/archaeal histone domain-containing protein n=1 Tax=Porphyridium purpureum TaxID=35688 RepID=A0A5J4YK81_PORPP|nr:hypothetical protein FVE85_8343 [Porphyridium purpureum]|eukprot:POR8622..scf244_11